MSQATQPLMNINNQKPMCRCQILRRTNPTRTLIIFNQQSIVRVTPAFDIDFDYFSDVASSELFSFSVQPAVTITLERSTTAP